MNKTGTFLAGSVAAVVVAALVAVAISDGGDRAGGLSVAVICAIVAFAINWIVYIPSFLAKTEHYFDLTGALTYLTVIVLSLVLSDGVDARAVLIAILVAVWAVRLGSFLFMRVKADGGDSRFVKLKLDWAGFLRIWTIQGLWVVFTLAAGVAAITSGSKTGIGVFAVVGAIVWVVGFAFEVTADRQKSAFKADPKNDGRFISTGVWAWSRHPNYFGEITLWAGIAIIAIPTLSGWQWVGMVSPIFVTLLLTKISGVPMLEWKSDKRWGDEPAYQAYKSATPVLFPRPPRS